LKFDKKKTDDDKVAGYHAYVRKKGKDKKITGRSLTKAQAINKMARRIDETPRASGFIKKSGSKIKPQDTSINTKLLSQFRRGKNNKKRYVEKNKYRINTKGELKGITKKGQRARRK